MVYTICMKHRIFSTSFAEVYPHYVAKAERRGRTRAEVDQLICWLTGYSQAQLATILDDGTNFEAFFAMAPAMNPARDRITGVICDMRVEDIQDPEMKAVRQLDKIIDELKPGKSIEKIMKAKT